MLVRETISFQRYKDPKTALFGLRPGQITKELWPNDEQGTRRTIGYYLILESEKESGNYISTELGYKMFDRLNIWSDYERYGLKFKLELVSDEEITEIKEAYKKEPEKLKSLKKYLNIWGFMDKKKELLQQLTESVAFQRYKDPKTVLFGMRPGTLLVDKIKFTSMGGGEVNRSLYMLIKIDNQLETNLVIIGLGKFIIYDKFMIFKFKEPAVVIREVYEEYEDELREINEDEKYILEEDIKVEEKPEALAVIKAIKEKFNIVPIL